VQDIRLDVVKILLGALLVAGAFDVGIGDLVDVEGRQFDLPASHGQNPFDEVALAQMALDLGPDRGCEPAIGMQGRPVAPPWLAIAGLAAAPGAAIRRSLLRRARHVVAQGYFGLVDDLAVGNRGGADRLAAGIHSRDDVLRVAAGAEQQLDRERVASHDLGLAVFEQVPGPGRRARHQGLSVVIQNID